MKIQYIINLPVYQYNTGMADNGNKIFKTYYNDLETAKNKLEFINSVYNQIQSDIELNDDDIEEYEYYFDLPGYQIAEAYITSVTERKI